MIRHSLIGISLRLRIADLPPCGRRERETIGGKLPTVLYVRVSSSYHGKVVLKITAVLLKSSMAFLVKKSIYMKLSKFSIPLRALCGLCVLQNFWQATLNTHFQKLYRFFDRLIIIKAVPLTYRQHRLKQFPYRQGINIFVSVPVQLH